MKTILFQGDSITDAGRNRANGSDLGYGYAGLAAAELALLGNESQSVGPVEAPMAVHLCLLSAGVVLLEGIRLKTVPEGEYFLCAAPLCLGGAEGAPCRALLVDPTVPDGQS